MDNNKAENAEVLQQEGSHTSIDNFKMESHKKAKKLLRGAIKTQVDRKINENRPKTERSTNNERNIYRVKTETELRATRTPVKKAYQDKQIQKIMTPAKYGSLTEEPINAFYKSHPSNEYGLLNGTPRYTSSGIVFVNEIYSNINRVLAKHRA